MWNRIKQNGIVLLIIALTVLVTVFLQNFCFKSYSRYASDTLHYEKAVVVEVLSEDAGVKFDPQESKFRFA